LKSVGGIFFQRIYSLTNVPNLLNSLTKCTCFTFTQIYGKLIAMGRKKNNFTLDLILKDLVLPELEVLEALSYEKF